MENVPVTCIESTSPSLDLGNWREVWRHRDLLRLLVRREFLASYQQTYLGAFWIILQPLLTSAVMTLVFTTAVRLPTDGVPPVLFYLSGLVLWNYFAQSVVAVASSLRSNAALFQKVYFPRLVAPLALVGWRAIAFGIHLVILGVLWPFYRRGLVFPEKALLLIVPWVFLQTTLIALGVGLSLAAVTVRYRDVQQVLNLLLQLWMYATPIIYPVSAITGKIRWLLWANPMTAPIETFRRAFFSMPDPMIRVTAISTPVCALFFFLGVALFRRAEETFVDTI